MLDMQTYRAKSDPAAWIIAAVSCIGLAALFLAGKGAILRMAIPVAATGVAVCLYFRKPLAYLEFALWCWLLTPFIRRVVDWRVGFADQNLVLLTPFLVSGIAILDLRERWRVRKVRMAPFILCGSAILYGFIVGMAIHPSGEVIYGMVNWLSPMLLGLHLYLHCDEFEVYSGAVRKVALWGLLILGTYGAYQFFKPPIWDTMWLENLPGGLESSTFGRPEPEQIRVWSTLNAPGPFASVTLALLFLVVPKRSKLKLPAVAVGVYSLMLSLVRTSWLTGALGLLFLAKNSNRKLFLKVVFAMGAGAIGVIVLANSSLNVPMIQDRFKTLGDLKNDESVHDRTRLYESLSKELLTLPVGVGLNNADFYNGYPLDSGPLRMLLNLGWFGTLSYSLGICQLIVMLFSNRNRREPALITSTTIVVTFILQLLSGLIFISSSGAMFWLAAGLGLAATMQPADASEQQPVQFINGASASAFDPRFACSRVIANPIIFSSAEDR